MPGSNVESELSSAAQTGSAPILVELVPRSGSVQASVSALSKENAGVESVEAMSSAMSLIQSMAQCLIAAIGDGAGSLGPSGAEIDFGIRFDADGEAFLARSGPEAALGVKLIWIR